MAAFNIGEIVQLKTGGPTMTVQKAFGGKSECKWFVGKKLETATFVNASLIRAEADESVSGVISVD